MRMTYVSLFSGIEAMSVAASRIREAVFEPLFFSEIERFPCELLRHRYPGVPNLGDVTKIEVDDESKEARGGGASVALPEGGVDLLVGGSPCQDVSIAGLRKGFADGTRSSLAFHYSRLVGALRPRWVCWENVPGVLSSNRGVDFKSFLDSLVERGYCCAWRVLDAEYVRVDGPDLNGFPKAVPQRRRRVWLVGRLGTDWKAPASVLFEAAGDLGTVPPRRESGKGAPWPAGYRSPLHAGVLEGQAWSVGNGQVNQVEPEEVAKTLDTMHDQQRIVCGFEYDHLNVTDVGRTLTGDHDSRVSDSSFGVVSALSLSMDSKASVSEDEVAYPVRCGKNAAHKNVVAIETSASFDGKDVSPTLRASNGTPGYSDQEVFEQKGAYLCRVYDPDRMEYIVRRLTPVECERLQGFPDDWTRIPYNGMDENECPETPRYQAIGNSWATNCAEWVLRRILKQERGEL